MKIKHLYILAIIFGGCSADNSVNYEIYEPKIAFDFAIYDEFGSDQYIIDDTIFFNNIDSSIMVRVNHVNISDQDAVVDVKNSDFQGWIHTVPIKSKNDKEVFITNKNVILLTTQWETFQANESEILNSQFSILIPIKIGVPAVIGNDTLELEASDLDFIDVSYKSPILELSGEDILYLEKF